MKKFLKSMLVCAIVVCFFLMSACSTTAGTYKFESLSYSQNGVEVNISAGEQYMGVTLTEDFMSFTFDKDGTGSATLQGATNTFTWTESNDEITVLYSNGSEVKITKQGNKLVANSDGVVMTFKKK